MNDIRIIFLPSGWTPYTKKGTNMSKYTEKDAGKDTNSSQKEVRKAWHDAREDAQKSGKLPEREANKKAGSKK